MSDRRTDPDLETRLEAAFRSADLPAAPGRLADLLERIPDEPVVARPSGRAGRSNRAPWGVLGLAAILVVGGAVALGVGSRGPSPSPAAPSAAPGAQITYQVAWSTDVPFSTAALAEEVRIVQARADATGAVGIAIRSDGQDRLVVDLPAEVDSDALRKLIGLRGDVAFVPLGDTQMEKGDTVDETHFPRLFGHEGIANVAVGTNGQIGQRVVSFQLTPAATTAFSAYTKAHIGQEFAIVLDGQVISAPVVQSEIPNGAVEISQNSTLGGFPIEEASELVTILQLGPLPAPLRETSFEPAPGEASGAPSAAASASAP
jgi:preprotein translocase subunit SecD